MEDYNNKKAPNSSNSSIDYLNSISATPQPESTLTKSNPINKKGIAIIIILATILAGLVIAIIVTGINKNATPTSDENVTIITPEEHRQKETLNQTLASIVEQDPNRDYESPNDFSPSYGATPGDIIDAYGIDITNPDYSSAISVPAMNSNILNYYLDQSDTIVYIVDQSGITLPNNSVTDIIIVYASRPSEYDFVGFIPADFNADGTNKNDELFPEQTAIYLSHSELFNRLTAAAEFYIVKKPQQ